MNVLEKILEEIDDYLYEKYCIEGEDGIGKIIRSHICDEDVSKKETTDWISVKERSPDEHDSIFKKFKESGHWRNIMFEKNSDKVNVTIELKDGRRKTDTSYTCDGKWNIEKEDFVNKVIAWQPLPEEYKGK